MASFEEMLEGPALRISMDMYKKPTEIQSSVIPLITAGHDVVAMSKTGSGKTAAFLLPLIQLLKEHSPIVGSRALIISPNRELALQIARYSHEYSKYTNLKTVSLIGGEYIELQFRSMTTNPDIIIATPGRLLEFIAEANYSLEKVQYLIFDEADLLFDKSQSLETAITAMMQLMPQKKQILMFSATMPKMLADFTQLNLKSAIKLSIDPTSLPSTLDLSFLFVSPPFKPALLLSTLTNRKSALVFVATRHHAEFISAFLNESGINSRYIHGSMDQDERSSGLAAFSKGNLSALIVTDVASRGLDIEGLDLVVNYDYPAHPKLFLHRGGRSGRAGRSGEVVSFVTQDELPYFAGTKEALNGQSWTIKRISKSEIDPYIMLFDDAIKRSHDLAHLKRGMEDGEKMYIRSRKAAKPSWLSAAKEIDIGAGQNTVEERLLSWRPKTTIFEQVAPTQKQKVLMKEIRLAHNGHVKTKQKPQKVEAPKPKPVVPQTQTQTSEPSKFFVGHYRESEQTLSIREGGPRTFMDAVMDLTPDDHTSLRGHGKSELRKKENAVKAILTGNRELIRGAVVQVTGMKSKGEKYQEWVQTSHAHLQNVGEVEKKMKLPKRFMKPRKDGRSEVKTPKQIEQERLIKMKHKLHDQGKHKEASEINRKIHNRRGK